MIETFHDPNPVSHGRQALWSWRDLTPVLLLALPGPILIAVMMLVKPDYELILFQNPIGMKMLAFASMQQVTGMVVHICWSLFGKKAPRWLSALIVVGVVVFFYLGSIFVVVVGPAAIAIYERMPRR